MIVKARYDPTKVTDNWWVIDYTPYTFFERHEYGVVPERGEDCPPLPEPEPEPTP